MTKPLKWSAAVVAWLLCGLLSTGGMTAYYQAEFCGMNTRDHYRDTLAFAAVGGLLFGPAALLATIGTTGALRHGWILKYTGQC